MSLSTTLLTLIQPLTNNAQRVGEHIALVDEEQLTTLVVADQLTTPTYVKLRSHVVKHLICDHGYELLQHYIGEGTVCAKLQSPSGSRFWLVFSNTDQFAIGVEC